MIPSGGEQEVNPHPLWFESITTKKFILGRCSAGLLVMAMPPVQLRYARHEGVVSLQALHEDVYLVHDVTGDLCHVGHISDEPGLGYDPLGMAFVQIGGTSTWALEIFDHTVLERGEESFVVRSRREVRSQPHVPVREFTVP